MRVVAGWMLMGLAALLLVLNLSGGSSAGAGCLVVLVALVGLALVGGKGGGSVRRWR